MVCKKCNSKEGFWTNYKIWRGFKQKIAIFQNAINHSTSQVVYCVSHHQVNLLQCEHLKQMLLLLITTQKGLIVTGFPLTRHKTKMTLTWTETGSTDRLLYFYHTLPVL